MISTVRRAWPRTPGWSPRDRPERAPQPEGRVRAVLPGMGGGPLLCGRQHGRRGHLGRGGDIKPAAMAVRTPSDRCEHQCMGRQRPRQRPAPFPLHEHLGLRLAIDNVTIKDLPANDMAPIRTWRTGFISTTRAWPTSTTTSTPAEQVREMQLKADAQQRRPADRGHPHLMQGPNGAEFNSASSPTGPCAHRRIGGAGQWLHPIGRYQYLHAHRWDDQDQTDDIPANNTVVRNIEVRRTCGPRMTAPAPAHSSRGPDNATDAYELGNHLTL